MVRTKGDGATTKAVGAKAPRKQLVSNIGGSSSAYSPNDSSKKNKPSTGLPYCPQPTPEWQKSVKSFFTFSGRESSEKSAEDKENEVMIVEQEGSDDGKRSKGKQPSKGKRSKKGDRTKKTSKPQETEEKNGDMSDEGKEATTGRVDTNESEKPETKSDDEKSAIKSDDEDAEPVQRKRNRIIESDEDE